MKLYEVPRNSRIRVLGDNKNPPAALPTKVGEEYNFKHLDGMYSYCTDDAGNVVHLVAWTEVEIV